MRFFGFELEHIADDFYDATEVFNIIGIFYFLLYCEYEGFVIVPTDDNRIVLKKLNDE